MEMVLLSYALLVTLLLLFLSLRISQKKKEAVSEIERIRKEQADVQEKERVRFEAELLAERSRYAELEKSKNELLAFESSSHKEIMEKQENDFKEKMKLMKMEFDQLASDILEKKTIGIKESNAENISAILKPLTEKMELFKQEVEANKNSGLENTSSIKAIIRNLIEQTQRIGSDANHLAEALKSKPKLQGNWGEMILKNLLESSGLSEGQEFFLQTATRDCEGNKLIPDAIVKFPDKRSVIIDSKVSLTAYADYMGATTEVDRLKYMKLHLESVWQHVKELSVKNYAANVKDAMDMVLMFMPNEGAYILAMQNDEKLVSEAYRYKVIIVNPTNLLLTLNLVYNLWQTEKQNRNVEKIISAANGIYDKFAVFTNTFVEMKNKINSLSKNYDEAEKQLVSGRGNIVKQVIDLKSLGALPKKEIHSHLLDGTDYR